jgi:hypothetical protein
MQNGTLEDKLVKIFNQESMIYLTPNETIKRIINNILYLGSQGKEFKNVTKELVNQIV